LLPETLLDDVPVEHVAVRGEQARLQEWRRVVNLVFFGLGSKETKKEKKGSSSNYAMRGGNAIRHTYPFVELRGVYGDQLGLLVSLQLEEACLLLHDLAQQEREQFFVISRLREIFPEALFDARRITYSKQNEPPPPR
jgi:hypothetical protein